MVTLSQKLLQEDGTLVLFENFFNEIKSNELFEKLLLLEHWKSDQIRIFGKLIETPRKVCWMAESAILYRYSGMTKTAIIWPDWLKQLCIEISNVCQTSFNSCLLNFYSNGNEYMGWHSDNEPEIQQSNGIACLSLGAERNLVFKHKHKPLKMKVLLFNGSLLYMQSPLQTFWKHCLPKQTNIVTPRISLTFRNTRNYNLSY